MRVVLPQGAARPAEKHIRIPYRKGQNRFSETLQTSETLMRETLRFSEALGPEYGKASLNSY